MRRCGWLGVVLLACCLLSGGPAGAQVAGVDLEGTTDAVDTVTSTADDLVGTGSGIVGGAVGSLGDSVGSVSDSAGEVVSAVGSGSAASGSTSSGSTTSSGDRAGARASGGSERGDRSRPRADTRFDRLPRRLEALLERIELGRNVAANLRRLERALESASPALRARVLRLIRAEIDRLESGRVTDRERRRIERLRHALETLGDEPAPAADPAMGFAPAAAAASGTEVFRAADPAAPTSGTLGERTAGRSAGDGARPSAPSSPADPLFPPDDGELPLVLGLVLLFVIGLGIAGLIGAVASQVRRPHQT